MNKTKILLYFLLPFFVLSCTSFSEVGKVMRNEKSNSADEFLVKKKEPLTLPPDFAEIPEPGSLEKKTNEEKEKKAIEETFRIDKVESSSNSKTGSVEESILKKIGK
jgi:hypothetical protein